MASCWFCHALTDCLRLLEGYVLFSYFQLRSFANGLFVPPSQHTVLGHHRPASETPFKWRFAGRPMSVPFKWVSLAGRWWSHSNGVSLTGRWWPLSNELCFRPGYYLPNNLLLLPLGHTPEDSSQSGPRKYNPGTRCYSEDCWSRGHSTCCKNLALRTRQGLKLKKKFWYLSHLSQHAI